MRILLADDHTMMREGMRAVLEKEGHNVVGEAGTGREAVALALATRPDVVVMDVSMPELNGIDATKQLRAELPSAKIVALSMHSDRRYVDAMLAAGATGYLLKASASSELILAVRTVASGGRYVSSAVEHGSPAEPESGRPLSTREREVLQLLSEGCSSKEIANRLGLAVPTVETHRRQIMAKLGLRTIAELTKYAVRQGLTSVDK